MSNSCPPPGYPCEPDWTRPASDWREAVSRKAFDEAREAVGKVKPESLAAYLESHGCIPGTLRSDGVCRVWTYPKTKLRALVPVEATIADYRPSVCATIFDLACELGWNFWAVLLDLEHFIGLAELRVPGYLGECCGLAPEISHDGAGYVVRCLRCRNATFCHYRYDVECKWKPRVKHLARQNDVG